MITKESFRKTQDNTMWLSPPTGEISTKEILGRILNCETAIVQLLHSEKDTSSDSSLSPEEKEELEKELDECRCLSDDREENMIKLVSEIESIKSQFERESKIYEERIERLAGFCKVWKKRWESARMLQITYENENIILPMIESIEKEHPIGE